MLKTIGSDIEVFAQNQFGKHIALCGMIGGTKENPLQIENLPDGFMFQEDNVSLEFNIPPCKQQYEWDAYIETIKIQAKEKLTTLNLIMSTDSSASFDNDQLLHPKALIFGCEPDYDAWKKIENHKPQAKNPNLRTCGGHIHVGSDINRVEGVRNMDLFLGVPSVLLDSSPSAIERKELYGKAGAMRPKPYGWEYRTLSNFWIFDEKLTHWIYSNTWKACRFGRKLTPKEGKRITSCINTNNKQEAENICKEYNITLI